VLAYHRVAAVPVDPWELAVAPDHFGGQLDVLRDMGRISPLRDLLDLAGTDRVMAHHVQFAVTFDDGYVDNLRIAVPLLEAVDAPATVFIAPGLLDRPHYWWDVLAALVLGPGAGVARLAAAARSTGLIGDDDGRTATDEAAASVLHGLLHARLITRSLGAIDDALERLAAALAIELPVPDGRPLTTDELMELAGHPLVSIGVHTMTHPQLPGLPPAEVRCEIADASQRLDELLGPSRRVLAYPYGASSPEVVRVAAELGVVHGVTTRSGWVRRRGDGLRVPRLQPRDVDADEFEEWLRRWT